MLAPTSHCVNSKRLRLLARPFTIAKKNRSLNVTAVFFLKRHFLVFATLVLLIASGTSAHAAQAYMIADSQTGYVLDEQKAQDKRQVGSLTKIATAMVVLDWAAKRGGDLNQLATIPPEAFVGTSENHIGFQPGDVITLRDLLYAALVQSDNIAAYALANHVGVALQSVIPTVPSERPSPVAIFVGQMNALAKRLEMERTRFLNPAGLDDKERPYSTAADMARLTRYATSNAGFRFYVSQKTRQIFATANKVLMLEHSIYTVISPEGAASILWHDSSRAQDAATGMKITAQDLQKFGVIDRIIAEPVGGAHREPEATIKAAGEAIAEALNSLDNLPPEEIRRQRREKYLAIGRSL